MTEPVSKGLMAFWTDIDEDYIMEFQKWHNCEHLTERTSLPGFNIGKRYRGLGRAPMFLISYETKNAEALRSTEYLQALNNSTPWTKEALQHFNNNIRNIYKLISTKGQPAPTEAPHTFLAHFNIKPGAEEETLDCHTREMMPGLAAIPGVFRIRLYEIDEEISNIMTGERAIYGGGPGQQKYLICCEINYLDLPSNPEWKAVCMSDSAGESMFSHRTDVFEEYSRLEMVMYSPVFFKRVA